MISSIYYIEESHKSDLEKKFFFADVIAQYQFRRARARARTSKSKMTVCVPCKRSAKSRESSVAAFDVASCYMPATLYPGIILQRNIAGRFYRRGTSTRGLTPVCLELRLQSQRGFIADLSSGFAKR